MRRTALLAATAVSTCLVLAAAASATPGGAGGLLPPSPHSPNANRINDAYLFIAIFTGLIFILVEGALVAFVVKYRRGRRARTAEGVQIHGSTRLEIAWTVFPVVILVAIGTFVFYKLPGIADVPKASASNEIRVKIDGHQFYWRYIYSNGATAFDTMRAPAGEVVREEVSAPDDGVIHSWWVPKLGGKTDAIPGSTNTTWFQAPVGTYEVRCAELCGVQHALMNAHVHVVPRAEFDSWVADRKTNQTSAKVGHEMWTAVCSKCHKLNAEFVGPAIGGNPLLADRKGLERLVRNGQGNMPAVGNDWTDAEIDALVAYTKRLGGGTGNGG